MTVPSCSITLFSRAASAGRRPPPRRRTPPRPGAPPGSPRWRSPRAPWRSTNPGTREKSLYLRALHVRGGRGRAFEVFLFLRAKLIVGVFGVRDDTRRNAVAFPRSSARSRRAPFGSFDARRRWTVVSGVTAIRRTLALRRWRLLAALRGPAIVRETVLFLAVLFLAVIVLAVAVVAVVALGELGGRLLGVLRAIARRRIWSGALAGTAPCSSRTRRYRAAPDLRS